MHELRALRVTGENDLGGRAPRCGLLRINVILPTTNRPRTYSADQVGHGRASRWIAALQESGHVRWVRDTLDGETARPSNSASKLVEKQGTDGCGVANIALLPGPTGVDHADRTAGGAVSELVVGSAAVLALREGVVLQGQPAGDFGDGEGLRVGDRSGSCEGTGEEGEGEESELHGG